MLRAYNKTGAQVKLLVCLLICDLIFSVAYGITRAMETDSPATFEIDREALTAAIVELNSMCPADGVIMTREGRVRTGYTADEDFLCMLIPAGVLARQLTADGLSSYTGKELLKWAGNYDVEPLKQKVSEALAQG